MQTPMNRESGVWLSAALAGAAPLIRDEARPHLLSIFVESEGPRSNSSENSAGVSASRWSDPTTHALISSPQPHLNLVESVAVSEVSLVWLDPCGIPRAEADGAFHCRPRDNIENFGLSIQDSSSTLPSDISK